MARLLAAQHRAVAVEEGRVAVVGQAAAPGRRDAGRRRGRRRRRRRRRRRLDAVALRAARGAVLVLRGRHSVTPLPMYAGYSGFFLVSLTEDRHREGDLLTLEPKDRRDSQQVRSLSLV